MSLNLTKTFLVGMDKTIKKALSSLGFPQKIKNEGCLRASDHGKRSRTNH
jgi:hypothetical protein